GEERRGEETADSARGVVAVGFGGVDGDGDARQAVALHRPDHRAVEGGGGGDGERRRQRPAEGVIEELVDVAPFERVTSREDQLLRAQRGDLVDRLVRLVRRQLERTPLLLRPGGAVNA